MSESLIYQFPLNESSRTYLRIEQLFQRCIQAMEFDTEQSGLSFFSSIFDILEVLERADIRQDLIKDLESQQKEIARWAQYPNVDQAALKQLDQSIQKCLGELRGQVRLANCLKDDRFLSGIRQRFSIPGGNCCFDVPQLHHWIGLDAETRQTDMHRWISTLDSLRVSIALLMQLVRDGKLFRPAIAKKGFYQDSAENLQLLRIDCPAVTGVYPTVSGNKHRFTVRFMSLDSQGSSVDQDIEFKLSVS
ncbi:cell division protein ZapD [Echinimonas agarilytica]|uniref:Cell division protein ZapD n=1 Tax=Echinimonas agarilytica TaxID=1215918 RepID=A0AA42B6R3_9GAMM|nr:cell division protein ZapD [Echinimonas agarilytica]MCM2678791.1 cell division protein ZapD [Echinimonas agarilytica]